MTTPYVTRFHATMVWDQLYGIDSKLQPQPQMVAGHTVEDEGRLWTFTLREGLRFHDGEPVRGRDCVASIKRWAVRDPMGQALLARLAEMTAPDDRRFTIRLTRPFSLVLDCLAKIGPPALVVMPERLAPPTPSSRSRRWWAAGRFVSWQTSAWSAPRSSMHGTRITCRDRTEHPIGWPGRKSSISIVSNGSSCPIRGRRRRRSRAAKWTGGRIHPTTCCRYWIATATCGPRTLGPWGCWRRACSTTFTRRSTSCRCGASCWRRFRRPTS